VEPGALWWAFARDQAFRRGRPSEVADDRAPALEPLHEVNAGRAAGGAVVLIDEIDKAEPDIPNALLVPLGSAAFRVAETHTEVRLDPDVEVLIVVTTNGERDLPPAFERRCVVYELPHVDEDQLVRIARAHAAADDRALGERDVAMLGAIAAKVTDLQEEAVDSDLRPAGIAEFLDAAWAALATGIGPDDDEWVFVESMTLRKDRRLL
jgi:MoxR-like ATPase